MKTTAVILVAVALGATGAKHWFNGSSYSDEGQNNTDRSSQPSDDDSNQDKIDEPTDQSGLVQPIRIGDPSKDPFDHDHRAHFHAHGTEMCRSGCALSNHATDKLKADEFRWLIERLSTETLSPTNYALDALLYYGKQSRDYLSTAGPGQLSSDREAMLTHELSRTHVQLQFRLVDDQGVVRTWLPSTRVPLDRRHEFAMEVRNLQPLHISGTVKRVGLDHLWVRL